MTNYQLTMKAVYESYVTVIFYTNTGIRGITYKAGGFQTEHN